MGILKSLFGGKPKLLSMVEFRDLFVAKLREAMPDVEAQIVDDRTVLVRREDAEGPVYVENTYNRYAADPSRLDVHIGQLLTLIANASAEAPLGVNQLVVVARHVDYGRSVGAAVSMKPLAGDVALLLAHDTPTALGAVTGDSLQKMEIDEGAAFARARANLRERMGEIDVQRFECAAVYHMTAASGLVTGALAIPELWRNGVEACAVFVDGREAFLWCDAADAEALAMLRNFAKLRIPQGTVSQTVIVLEGETWRDIGL